MILQTVKMILSVEVGQLNRKCQNMAVVGGQGRDGMIRVFENLAVVIVWFPTLRLS